MRRSRFNLSHEHKLSVDMGYLVPVNTEEVLPGDTFMGSASLLARIAPLATPVMHSVDIRLHHWYVPNRILWSDWDEWIQGDDTGTYPQHTINTGNDTRLIDHMGIPPENGMVISELPIRAYNKIWNEFYRDQDLNSAVSEGSIDLQRICWEKDYFTTARATPQQGTAVDIDFSAGRADVRGLGVKSTGDSFGVNSGTFQETGGEDVSAGASQGDSYKGLNTSDVAIRQSGTDAGYPDIYADLSTATGGIAIDDLRRSVALQRFAEARSRFGSRYVDYLRYLGVNPSDGRLDRPEYLGGGSQKVSFSEVIAMAEGTTTEVGDLYGHGIASLKSRRYRKMFEEHGWFMTLMSVRPRTVYENAVPRKFLRTDAMDYWQKELEVLPWQSITEQEVYAPGSTSTVFGYVPKYDEYRHSVNHVSGTFRDGTEGDWHMARRFTSAPTLNGSFVECTPTDRIYSDTSMAEVLVNVYNNVQAMRLVRANAAIGTGAGL